MARDPPPQTVQEAIEMGWTALAFRCNLCKHDGTVNLAPFDRAGQRLSLAWLFWRCQCGKCRCRPTCAKLALQTQGGAWYMKRIEIDGGTIRRAARE